MNTKEWGSAVLKAYALYENKGPLENPAAVNAFIAALKYAGLGPHPVTIPAVKPESREEWRRTVGLAYDHYLDSISTNNFATKFEMLCAGLEAAGFGPYPVIPEAPTWLCPTCRDQWIRAGIAPPPGPLPRCAGGVGSSKGG